MYQQLGGPAHSEVDPISINTVKKIPQNPTSQVFTDFVELTLLYIISLKEIYLHYFRVQMKVSTFHDILIGNMKRMVLIGLYDKDGA